MKILYYLHEQLCSLVQLTCSTTTNLLIGVYRTSREKVKEGTHGEFLDTIRMILLVLLVIS